MDIEHLFATTVRYIYEDYHNKNREVYSERRWGKLTKEHYDKKIEFLIWERKGRILSLWQNLSYDDQIAFYLKSSAQETIFPHLSQEQACAIIIIQDSLVVHHE